MRTFLVVVVVLSFGLGWIANLLIRVRQQRAVVAQIEAAGGWIRYEHQGLCPTPTDSGPGPYWVRCLVGHDAFAHVSNVGLGFSNNNYRFHPGKMNAAMDCLPSLPRITDVHLDGFPVMIEDLETIATLPRLRRLTLRPSNNLLTLGNLQGATPRLEHLALQGTFSDGKAIETLPELPQLKTLWLDGTRITAAGMQRFASSRQLSMVIFEHCQSIDDGALEAISSLPNLKELEILGTPLSARNMQELSQFAELRGLRISNCPAFQMNAETNLDRWQHLGTFAIDAPSFNDHHAARLAACKQLESLSLNHTSVTDAAIPEIIKLKKLWGLRLVGTAVTGDGLRQLRTLAKLEHVTVSAPVTASDVEELQQHLSKCDISIEDRKGRKKTFPFVDPPTP